MSTEELETMILNHRSYGTCCNDSRNADIYHMTGVTFIPFPNFDNDFDLCRRLISLRKGNLQTLKNIKDNFICTPLRYWEWSQPAASQYCTCDFHTHSGPSNFQRREMCFNLEAHQFYKLLMAVTPNGEIVSFQNKIDEESREVNTLLLYAKGGQWDNIWPIIGTPENPKRAYLINSIPENRRWGVLHQAVYWKDPNIVQKLLKFRACDSSLRTKECTSEVGPTSGMTAIELASAYGCTEVKKVLTNHICNFKTETEEIDTFYPWHADIERKGLGLIPITLAAYKNTFHPKNIDPKKPIVTVLGDIFNDLNTSPNRWKDVRDKICDSLYVVSEESAKELKACASRQNFYETIVNVYTEESTFLYTYMNTALRRQKESDYNPSAIDLAMGPYVVMYQTLLLFWPELKRENAKTYRRMLLTKKDVEKYQIRVKFTWLSFVSSSVELEKALPFPTRSTVKGGRIVIFTIDNTVSSTHTPRNIETYARYMERERVYPTGSKFVVTGMHWQNGEMYVDLKLLSS